MGLWLFVAGRVYVDVGRGGGGEAMSTGVVGTDLDGFRVSWKVVLFLDTPYLVDRLGTFEYFIIQAISSVFF